VRKIYIYEEQKNQMCEFINKSNIKVKKKFGFILRYISDESNPMKEPYVKHFSIEKYKMLYELRLRASNTMIRIIFYCIYDKIILLYPFIKKDSKDTERALEYSLKLIEKIDVNSIIPIERMKEVDFNWFVC